MPKKTDRRIVIQTYQLRQAGLSLPKIMDKLHDEFGDETPNESTVSRWCSKFKTDPPEGFEEDVPFTWGTMTEVPWAQSREILDAWAWYITDEENYFGVFNRRTAKWVWRVLQALRLGSAPDDQESGLIGWQHLDIGVHPRPLDITHIAREYAWREIASVVFQERLVTDDLDLWLALQPWRSRMALESYYRVTDEGRNHVTWHYLDLDWLDKVVPGLVGRALLSEFLGQNIGPTAPYGARGLLESQNQHWLMWLMGQTFAIYAEGLDRAELEDFYAEDLGVRLRGTIGEVITGSELLEKRRPWYIEFILGEGSSGLDDARRSSTLRRVVDSGRRLSRRETNHEGPNQTPQ